MKFGENTIVGRLHQRKFVRDAFGLSVARGLNLVLGAVSMLIYGAVFTKSQIAAISLFDMVVVVFLAFGVEWSALGITRFGKEELREQQSLNYTSSTRLYLMLPILIAGMIGIAIFRDPVLAYVGSTDPRLIWYILGGLFLLAAHDHVTCLFTAREMHHANALFYVAQSILRLFVVGIFYFQFVEPSVLLFVAGIIWLDALLLLLRLPACAKPYTIPLKRIRWDDLWEYLRYTAPQLYGFVGLYVINWIDVYFIRKHCTLDDLGAYQFLYGIFMKVCAFAMLTNSLLFPRVMAWRLANPDTISRLMRQAPPVVFLAVSIGCAALLLLFPPLLQLAFGDKYEVAYTSFTLMLCSVPFCFTTFLFVPVLNSFDRVSTVQWVNIISAGFNFVIDFALVPRYGIVGAAVGTFVAYGVIANLLMYAAHQLFSVRLMTMFAMTAGVVAFATWYFLASVAL